MARHGAAVTVFLVQIFARSGRGGFATRRVKRWGREDIDPLAAREPDRGVWIGEGEGEVDYE